MICATFRVCLLACSTITLHEENLLLYYIIFCQKYFSSKYSFVFNCSMDLYCIFSNLLLPKSFYNDPHPPFYQTGELGPTPHILLSTPPPPPMLGFFDFTGNRKILRQDRTLFKNKKNRNNRTYKHFTYQGKNKLHYLNTMQCSILFSNKSTCCEITQFYFQNYDYL